LEKELFERVDDSVLMIVLSGGGGVIFFPLFLRILAQ
jgi:hypothetical protein